MDIKLIECLGQLYAEFNVSADVIVTDPKLRERFALRLSAKTGRPKLATEEAMRLLLRCRKSGHLPCLGRGT